MRRSIRYWDSATFLAWLLPEESRLADCRGVVRAAERGDTLIVTSAVTLTEVIHLKGHLPVGCAQEAKITKFFAHSWISVRSTDSFVAEMARQLIWRHGVKPKDAIHLATAVRWKVPLFETFDDELIALDRKLGKPPLRTAKPHEAEVLELPGIVRPARSEKKKRGGSE
jgi:predicted nucleic acid-binding protein